MNPLFFGKKMKNFLPFVKLNCHDNFHRVIDRQRFKVTLWIILLKGQFNRCKSFYFITFYPPKRSFRPHVNNFFLSISPTTGLFAHMQIILFYPFFPQQVLSPTCKSFHFIHFTPNRSFHPHVNHFILSISTTTGLFAHM